ncbi:MAG: polyhydroxyalkanoic acid system family protein [Rudaea sp.]
MASIDIRRKHGQTPQQAREQVDQTAAVMSQKFGLSSEWIDDTLHFKRTGVHGRIQVTPTEIIVHAELGFLLGAMKPMIEREITERLEKRSV